MSHPSKIHPAVGRRWAARSLLAGVVLLAAVAIAMGCRKPKALRTRGVPKPPSALPTTRADLYFGNLDAQIAELTRVTAGGTEMNPELLALSGAHYTRGRFRGDLDEIQLAIDETSTCVRATPDNAGCLMTRAEQEQSLHRFKEARADLGRAKALGIDPARAAAVEMDLDWNDGRYDAAIGAIRAARLRHPSTSTWIREAQLDHDLGREDEADAAFEAAEDLIRDTGPLVVAHLDVQRGIQKMQTGRLEEACVFFRAAVERIPDYVAGNEHLGEALHLLGKDDEATRIYERVVKLSSDPEFFHALAVQYAAAGKTDQARELDDKARAGYAALLVKYPEAMYWHASEFYLSIGAASEALALLEKNVVLRPNSTSYVALARAELAAFRLEAARTSIDKALAMPVVSASLFWTAARVYRRAGGADSAKAAGFEKRALAINPRIAAEEPDR